MAFEDIRVDAPVPPAPSWRFVELRIEIENGPRVKVILRDQNGEKIRVVIGDAEPDPDTGVQEHQHGTQIVQALNQGSWPGQGAGVTFGQLLLERLVSLGYLDGTVVDESA